LCFLLSFPPLSLVKKAGLHRSQGPPFSPFFFFFFNYRFFLFFSSLLLTQERGRRTGPSSPLSPPAATDHVRNISFSSFFNLGFFFFLFSPWPPRWTAILSLPIKEGSGGRSLFPLFIGFFLLSPLFFSFFFQPSCWSGHHVSFPSPGRLQLVLLVFFWTSSFLPQVIVEEMDVAFSFSRIESPFLFFRLTPLLLFFLVKWKSSLSFCDFFLVRAPFPPFFFLSSFFSPCPQIKGGYVLLPRDGRSGMMMAVPTFFASPTPPHLPFCGCRNRGLTYFFSLFLRDDGGPHSHLFSAPLSFPFLFFSPPTVVDAFPLCGQRDLFSTYPPPFPFLP